MLSPGYSLFRSWSTLPAPALKGPMLCEIQSNAQAVQEARRTFQKAQAVYESHIDEMATTLTGILLKSPGKYALCFNAEVPLKDFHQTDQSLFRFRQFYPNGLRYDRHWNSKCITDVPELIKRFEIFSALRNILGDIEPKESQEYLLILELSDDQWSYATVPKNFPSAIQLLSAKYEFKIDQQTYAHVDQQLGLTSISVSAESSRCGLILLIIYHILQDHGDSKSRPINLSIKNSKERFSLTGCIEENQTAHRSGITFLAIPWPTILQSNSANSLQAELEQLPDYFQISLTAAKEDQALRLIKKQITFHRTPK